MSPGPRWARFFLAAFVLLVVACQDAPVPTEPPDQRVDANAALRSQHAPQELAAWFAEASPEVLELPHTVFADHDEQAELLVFGVENPGVSRGVENVLRRHGVPASAYRIQVTQPIQFMSTTLRTEHRPTRGGIQIHFPGFLCTLGFNVDQSSVRSFITNSHCTTEQGTVTGTPYYQPTSTVNPSKIATEAADPAYFTGSPCPSNRRCRYSDAARARYESGTDSNRGEIARTTGLNNGSITVDGSFWITEQNSSSTSFSGSINKVGRTTGWSAGNVTNSCANVNVSGTDITLLCQTLVQRRGRQIVGGGDSGSPVFQTLSGDNVRLVGILWGGNINGDTFVFSPLKGVQDELGTFAATGTAPPPDDGGDDGGDGDGGGGGGNCPPGNPNHKNCS